MGLFTRIKHPVDGREIQIKCGWDDMECYSVGDTVDWFFAPDSPGEGKLLDGIYDGCCYPEKDAVVIIKDHKIFMVLDREDASIKEPEDEYCGCIDYDGLAEKYKIVPVERTWWPEEVWEKLRLRKEAADKEHEEWKKSVAHFPQEKQLALAMIRPISRSLGYESIARKVLSIQPLDPVSLPKGDVFLLNYDWLNKDKK